MCYDICTFASLETEQFLVTSVHLRACKRMAHVIKSVRMLVTLKEGIFPYDAIAAILSF